MSARDRLNNPHLTPAELAQLAYEHPDLHQLIATHPVAYPELLGWLVGYSPDPHARQLAEHRLAGRPMPPPPIVPPTGGAASSPGASGGASSAAQAASSASRGAVEAGGVGASEAMKAQAKSAYGPTHAMKSEAKNTYGPSDATKADAKNTYGPSDATKADAKNTYGPSDATKADAKNTYGPSDATKADAKNTYESSGHAGTDPGPASADAPPEAASHAPDPSAAPNGSPTPNGGASSHAAPPGAETQGATAPGVGTQGAAPPGVPPGPETGLAAPSGPSTGIAAGAGGMSTAAKAVIGVVAAGGIGTALTVGAIVTSNNSESSESQSIEAPAETGPTSAEPSEDPASAEPTETTEPTEEPSLPESAALPRLSAVRIDDNLVRIDALDIGAQYAPAFDPLSPYAGLYGGLATISGADITPVEEANHPVPEAAGGVWYIYDEMMVHAFDMSQDIGVSDLRAGAEIGLPATRPSGELKDIRIISTDRILGVYSSAEFGGTVTIDGVELVMFDRSGAELWSRDGNYLMEGTCSPGEEPLFTYEYEDQWIGLGGSCSTWLNREDGSYPPLEEDQRILVQEPSYIALATQTDITIMDVQLADEIVSYSWDFNPVESIDADLDDLLKALETIDTNPPEQHVAIVAGGNIVDFRTDPSTNITEWQGGEYLCDHRVVFLDSGNQLLCSSIGESDIVYNADGSIAYQGTGISVSGYLELSNKDQWIYTNGVDFGYLVRSAP